MDDVFNNEWKEISTNDRNRAYKNLKNYQDVNVMNDNYYFNGKAFVSGALSKEQYICTSLKRSLFSDMKINKCEFDRCALTGSTFKNTNISNTILTGNNLLSCKFLNVQFYNNIMQPYISNAFSQSYFESCSFLNIIFKTSTISQAIFNNCKFSNCEFKSVTLESTKFLNCKFDDIDMSHMNIEYTIFVDCSYNKMVVPFYQFPYIISCSEMFSINNDIKYVAAKSVASYSEYKEILRDLIIYFQERHSFFCLTNIYLLLGDRNNAINNLKKGIEESLKNQDFRMIKFYCRLGMFSSIIDPNLNKEIIDYIDDQLSQTIRKKELDNYISINQLAIHSGEIKQLLCFNTDNKSNLTFKIQTNIEDKDVKKLNKLFNKIQRILDKYGIGADVKFVEIKHNSPYELLVAVTSDPLLTVQVSLLLIEALTKPTIFFTSKIKNAIKTKKIRELSIERQIIDKIKKIPQLNAATSVVDKEWYLKGLNAEIENILRKSKIKNKNITSITQSISGKVNEYLTKDILMFKINNDELVSNKK